MLMCADIIHTSSYTRYGCSGIAADVYNYWCPRPFHLF